MNGFVGACEEQCEQGPEVRWLARGLPRGFALEYNYGECIQARSGKFGAN